MAMPASPEPTTLLPIDLTSSSKYVVFGFSVRRGLCCRDAKMGMSERKIVSSHLAFVRTTVRPRPVWFMATFLVPGGIVSRTSP